MKILDFYTVRQYAKINDIPKTTVYNALQKGRLQGYKMDNFWLIPKDALIAHRQNRTGALNGITDLKNGRIDLFLEKRGYRVKQP